MKNRLQALKHEFVEFIPDNIEPGKIYVSLTYATAAHKCCCGCGQEVVTPLSPTDWQLTFDGESISLYPSIGNWSFPCESHYWIEDGRIVWAARMSKKRIEEGRALDRHSKDLYFKKIAAQRINATRSEIRDEVKEPDSIRADAEVSGHSSWSIKKWLKRIVD